MHVSVQLKFSLEFSHAEYTHVTSIQIQKQNVTNTSEVPLVLLKYTLKLFPGAFSQ